jgi:hypothetical protein
MTDFTITNHSNGDSTVNHTTAKNMTSKALAPIHRQDFLLLNPLRPSYFGYDDGEVTRMVNELEFCGVGSLMVDTGQEIFLYAYASRMSTLEDLCSAYDLGGIVVQCAAVYDQIVRTELAA